MDRQRRPKTDPPGVSFLDRHQQTLHTMLGVRGRQPQLPNISDRSGPGIADGAALKKPAPIHAMSDRLELPRTQFSSISASMRSKCRVLFVTRIAPGASAWVAIILAKSPIGVPRERSAARKCPCLSAAASFQAAVVVACRKASTYWASRCASGFSATPYRLSECVTAELHCSADFSCSSRRSSPAVPRKAALAAFVSSMYSAVDSAFWGSSKPHQAAYSRQSSSRSHASIDRPRLAGRSSVNGPNRARRVMNARQLERCQRDRITSPVRLSRRR